jgi:hypothetical protein
MARKTLIIPEAIRQMYVSLISEGDSHAKASRITNISRTAWQHLIARDKAFSAEIKKAEECASGELAILMRQSMRKMIAAGNPWAFKVAMRNFKTGLIDPSESESEEDEAPEHSLVPPSDNVVKLEQQKETRGQRAMRLQELADKKLEQGLLTASGMALAAFLRMAFERAKNAPTVEATTLNIGFSSKGEEEKTA